MTFGEFKALVCASNLEICRETLHQTRDRIKIKKEKRVIENLNRIFEATLRISSRIGFQAMSMRNLSRESGLSMGALYTYFSSKEELLGMMQTCGQAVVHRTLDDQIKSAPDARSRLRLAIQTHLYLSETLQPWFFFFYMEAKNLSREDRKRAIANELFTEKIFADLIALGKREKLFQVADPVLTASVIKAMLQDWYLKRWKYRRRKVSPDEYCAFVIDFVESYLCRRER